jgi:hypothetical protein
MRPVAEVEMAARSAVVMRGMSRPLSFASISSAAEASGVVVPMPTLSVWPKAGQLKISRRSGGEKVLAFHDFVFLKRGGPPKNAGSGARSKYENIQCFRFLLFPINRDSDGQKR